MESPYQDIASLKSKNSKLKTQNNVIKSMFLVFFAVCLSILMILVTPLYSENKTLKREVDIVHAIPVHPLHEFNRGALSELNRYRSEKSLPTVEYVPPEMHKVIAVWQGCAMNKHIDPKWDKEKCESLISLGDGMTTTFEAFDMGTIPMTNSAFTEHLDAVYTESKLDKKTPKPLILDRDIKHVMIYAIGEGEGKPWKVYTFIVKSS